MSVVLTANLLKIRVVPSICQCPSRCHIVGKTGGERLDIYVALQLVQQSVQSVRYQFQDGRGGRVLSRVA